MDAPKHSSVAYVHVPSSSYREVTSSGVSQQERQRNSLLMGFLLIYVSFNLISHPLEKPLDYPRTYEIYEKSTYFMLFLGVFNLVLSLFSHKERAAGFFLSVQLSGCASLAYLFMLRSFLQIPGESLFRSFLMFLGMVAVFLGVPFIANKWKTSRGKN